MFLCYKHISQTSRESSVAGLRQLDACQEIREGYISNTTYDKKNFLNK